MKKIVMGVVVALTLVARSGYPAIQYEFFQTSRTDSDTNQSSEMNGRATVDGQRTRVDFLSGSAYPPGTYVISTDGAKKLLFVDPLQKTYTEFNAMAIAAAIGTTNIKISNLQSTVVKLEDGRIIAGIPTDHYRLTMSYDITVNLRHPITQSVRTTIDKWTTVRFGESASTAFDNAAQTGNAQVDELIAAETTKIKGFPLKQTIQVVTLSQLPPSRDSQLQLPATRTRSHEMTVTSISEIQPKDTLFTVPAGFRKLNFDDNVTKSQTQVLSAQPAQ